MLVICIYYTQGRRVRLHIFASIAHSIENMEYLAGKQMVHLKIDCPVSKYYTCSKNNSFI